MIGLLHQFVTEGVDGAVVRAQVELAGAAGGGGSRIRSDRVAAVPEFFA